MDNSVLPHSFARGNDFERHSHGNVYGFGMCSHGGHDLEAFVPRAWWENSDGTMRSSSTTVSRKSQFYLQSENDGYTRECGSNIPVGENPTRSGHTLLATCSNFLAFGRSGSTQTHSHSLIPGRSAPTSSSDPSNSFLSVHSSSYTQRYIIPGTPNYMPPHDEYPVASSSKINLDKTVTQEELSVNRHFINDASFNSIRRIGQLRLRNLRENVVPRRRLRNLHTSELSVANS